LGSYYTEKVSTIINYLIPYRRLNIVRALSTENSSQPVTNNAHISSKSKPVTFDTDMVEIKGDTGCSYSMSGSPNDFLQGTITPVNVNTTVSVYGGAKVQITGRGTLQWIILDDLGRTVELLIPNSLYIQGTKARLLSPQHYAQEYTKLHAQKTSEVITTVHSNRIVMYWSAFKCKKTIPLDESNLGTLYTAPGFKNYRAFCAQMSKDNYDNDEIQNTCCYECTFDSDATKNEGTIDNPLTRLTINNNKNAVSKATNTNKEPLQQNSILDKGTLFEKAEPMREESLKLDITEGIFKDTIQDNESVLDNTNMNEARPEDLLLLLHYKFGHVSMQRLKRMAERGILPKKIINLPKSNLSGMHLWKDDSPPLAIKAKSKQDSSYDD
jgi:hypothetical protein